MANKYFGTDGIRDVANKGNLSPERVLLTGRALGGILRRSSGPKRRPRAGIAADTRISGQMILAALTAGLCSMGAEVIDFGILPTPALAFLTRTRGLDMGIMISASHNPMADNGIKVFQGDGFKLSDDVEVRVEKVMDGDAPLPEAPTGAGLGVLHRDPSGRDEYVSFLEERFAGIELDGLDLAVDCANGAAWKTAPEILTRLGARLHVMANSPNGTNINHACGSTHVHPLKEFVLAVGCDAGLALDGDGDRSIFVDSSGAVVDGDALMAFMGPWLKSKGALPGDAVVATVMSNLGLEKALEKEGIRLERTPVGDRFVSDRMKEGGFSLGGEQSGHIIFGEENNYTGDGTYTALKLFAAMAETGSTLGELVEAMERFPQILINVPVSRKPPMEELAAVKERIAAAEEFLGGEGRVLVRYSGTEKKARVMIEGRDAAFVREQAESIAAALRAEIG